MTHTTDPLLPRGTTAEVTVAALHRALALAEAAGDTARAATLRAAWFDLERRRLTLARAARPWHQERRRHPPPRDRRRAGRGVAARGPPASALIG